MKKGLMIDSMIIDGPCHCVTLGDMWLPVWQLQVPSTGNYSRRLINCCCGVLTCSMLLWVWKRKCVFCNGCLILKNYLDWIRRKWAETFYLGFFRSFCSHAQVSYCLMISGNTAFRAGNFWRKIRRVCITLLTICRRSPDCWVHFKVKLC